MKVLICKRYYCQKMLSDDISRAAKLDHDEGRVARKGMPAENARSEGAKKRGSGWGE
jgi:hypothetical protein